jgi:hypothetical protein
MGEAAEWCLSGHDVAFFNCRSTRHYDQTGPERVGDMEERNAS